MLARQVVIKSRSISLYEYVVVFILIAYAARGSEFVRAIDSWENILGLFLPIAAVAVLGFIKNVHFNHRFWFFLAGYVLWFTANTLKFHSLHPRFFGINIINIFLGYVAISTLRLRFFKIYEDLLFFLCIVGFSFWVIQNIIPSPFIEFLRNFEFSNQGVEEDVGPVDFNTLIYTVGRITENAETGVNLFGIRFYRNSGFAWEPGVFACYVNIAIFVNFIRNKFEFKNNYRLLLFVVTLATTFSTTGYSIFVLLILFFLYNQELVKIVWLIPIAVTAGVIIFSLPFMSDKIIKNAEEKANIERLIYLSAKYETLYIPQRFQSVEIDFVDFLNHPILGYGGHMQAKWTNQLGAQISTASGIGKVMAQYGVIGIIFFLVSLWKSSKQLVKIYNVRGIIFPILMILFISVSYDIIFTALLMSIWMLWISNFYKREVIKKVLMFHSLGKEKENLVSS